MPVLLNLNILFTKYYWGVQIKEDDMSRMFHAWEKGEIHTHI
jgi:hypothetical protein